MAAAEAAFSLREVLDAFRRCVTEQQEVLLEPYLSGWRGLIRGLHRALRWLQLFLQGLLSGESRTSVLCTDAYNASLAEHHPWLIRKAATVAFCALPSRDAFLDIMNVGTNEEAEAVLGEAIPYISQVYSITQELFERHQLLDLP
ncbi:PREDICTED: ceramide-1-phosphate transfer protein [Ficedula albicollis]|uniref:ceramide-1-phosphate transfer protein n=1 Tax=Ficedula albicollis TaxID=59894 RepID=UPI000359858C|nr:PREDICTED: ceramide-1-phosphate transfer protein [Ficedula albicollis]